MSLKGRLIIEILANNGEPMKKRDLLRKVAAMAETTQKNCEALVMNVINAGIRHGYVQAISSDSFLYIPGKDLMRLCDPSVSDMSIKKETINIPTLGCSSENNLQLDANKTVSLTSLWSNIPSQKTDLGPVIAKRKSVARSRKPKRRVHKYRARKMRERAKLRAKRRKRLQRKPKARNAIKRRKPGANVKKNMKKSPPKKANKRQVPKKRAKKRPKKRNVGFKKRRNMFRSRRAARARMQKRLRKNKKQRKRQ
ncbi:uncharacterized protein LOC119661907 [Teleopsis dalmanni]|uniref:uncharacterized protein LOC119661907 n=1 Tax=Teleopsis dalmanni TaxID=139649 RepID=UPI0018CF0DE5|nr:uncharacterized protein LOC119661907 [Teleopsis dalmanni]XP_037927346.1 uncharacterized protein LOC119661907 [Teleopsis dalmanni]